MLENLNIPGHLSKALKNIQNAKEKAAENKMLLDTGENLVMYLASFVLGEYRKFELEDIKFEKSFYANRANLSFGIYLGFIREGMKVIQKEKKNGLLEPYFVKNDVYDDISKFIHAFDILKKFVNNGGTSGFVDELAKNQKQNYGKTNILEFFNTFIELRNRTAHPHKEIMDKQSGISKTVTWPFSDEYFDYMNPFTKSALNQVVATLAPVWEYINYSIEAREEQNYTLKSFEDETLLIAEIGFDYPVGATVLIDKENNFYQCNDLRTLMQVGPNVIAAIEAEEAEKRKIADLEGLKDNIKMALDDGQISVEEFKTFQTIARNKFEMDEAKLKEFIIKIANELGIEDPFPEIDKRFIASIDNALITKDFNRLILKLQAEQYGVNSEDFEKLLQERADELKVDLEDVEKNAKMIVDNEIMKDVGSALKVSQWMHDIKFWNEEFKYMKTLPHLVNNTEYIEANDISNEDLFKKSKQAIELDALKSRKVSTLEPIAGRSKLPGTKEYIHFNIFEEFREMVQSQINRYNNSEQKWIVSTNKWLAGAMTGGYLQGQIYPENCPFDGAIALNTSGNRSGGYIHIDIGDLKKVRNYDLLTILYKQHLLEFINNYKKELLKYDIEIYPNRNIGHNIYNLDNIIDKIDLFIENLFDTSARIILSLKEKNTLHTNAIKKFKELEIMFNLFNPLMSKIVDDYEMLSSTFISPIKKYQNDIELYNQGLINFFNIKLNEKSIHYELFEFNGVMHHFHCLDGYEIKYLITKVGTFYLNYGFWIDLKGDGLSYGIKLLLNSDSQEPTKFEKYKDFISFISPRLSDDNFYNVDYIFSYKFPVIIENDVIKEDDLLEKIEKIKIFINKLSNLASGYGIDFLGLMLNPDEYQKENSKSINYINNKIAEIIKSKISKTDYNETDNTLFIIDNIIGYGLMFEGKLNRPYWYFKAEANPDNKKLMESFKQFAKISDENCKYDKIGSLLCKIPFINPNDFEGEDYQLMLNQFEVLFSSFMEQISASGVNFFC